jgi:tetratricopeptide (TPR) repeat protein
MDEHHVGCGWFKDAIDALELLTIRLSELSSNDPEVVLIYAQTKKFLGEFYFLIGDYQLGSRELQNGLQRINEIDRSKEESEMYRLLGSYNSASGHDKDSKEMYRNGLILAEKTGVSLWFINLSTAGSGSIYGGRCQNAMPIAEHALEIARQLDDKSKIVQSLNDLGILYYSIKEYPRAKELLTETLAYLPDIKSQFLEYTILNTLGRVLTANEEYHYASQIFSEGLNLIKDTNADPWAVEMLVNVSELLNGMGEKSVAITLVNLLVDHPMVSTEVKARAVRLFDALTAEKIQPENRDWSLDQTSRIMGDVMLILDQKNNFE